MKNFKKYFLTLLLAFTLANLTFCLMPEPAEAEVLEISQHPCEEGVEKKNTVPEKNSVLPCCQDHDKIIKIDNPKNEILLGIILGSKIDIENFFQSPILKKTAFVRSLDLPPPEGDFLSSVIKKE